MKTVKADKTIQIGVIGCGYWGPNLVRKFASHKMAHVRWLCDLKKERLQTLKRQYAVSHTTCDVSDVLGDPETDAVIIATPLHTHFDIARKALLAGKHVFVEKSFVPSVKQARELTRIAKQQKRILMVGFSYIYSPAIRKIKQVIDKGTLGKVHYLHSVRANLGIFRDKESVIWDLAAHDFSILSYLFSDEIVEVACAGHDSFRRGVADTATITATFSSGMTAYVWVSWHAPVKVRTMFLGGSKKMLFFNDERCTEKIRIYGQDRLVVPLSTTGEYQPVSNCNEVFSPWVGGVDALTVEVDHFFECIQKKKNPITDGVMGMAVVRVLEAVEKALATRRRVVLSKKGR